jgi:AraC-like DNA-binding protein
MGNPTMSMRLVHPFVRAVKRRGLEAQVVRFLECADPDARILASNAVKLVRVSVSLTGDETLGLLAALETSRGEYGDVEYAAGSCSTVREALDFLRDHYYLLDEASSFDYHCIKGYLNVVVRQPLEVGCRPITDFTLAMMYLCHVRWIGVEPVDCEVWFPYPRPADLGAHERVFGSRTRLRFGTRHAAVLHPQSLLKSPLRHSDPRLHELLVRGMRDRQVIRGLRSSVIDVVRMQMLETLPHGNANIEHIAKSLAMSRRTLARKLQEEGTSFEDLLRDVRSATAVRYLLLESYSIEQTATQLGYSEPSAFHRAFRNWFGTTPAEYRSRQRAVRALA